MFMGVVCVHLYRNNGMLLSHTRHFHDELLHTTLHNSSENIRAVAKYNFIGAFDDPFSTFSSKTVCLDAVQIYIDYGDSP